MAMRVFKNKLFNRWARSEGIADTALSAAAAEVVEGSVEADLGCYLFKKRWLSDDCWLPEGQVRPDRFSLCFLQERKGQHFRQGGEVPAISRRWVPLWFPGKTKGRTSCPACLVSI